MEKLQLKASKRNTVGRKVKALRRQGQLPANVYGKKVKSQAVSVEEKELVKVFSKAGETGLVELILDSDKKPVLIHNVQHHPVTGKILHVDFYQVDLKEKVTAKVPIAIIGESLAVRDKIGVLLTLVSELEVESLPADLPEKIEIDISGLAAVDQTVKVADLKVSQKIKILADQNKELVKVAPLVSKEAEQMAKEEAEKAAAAVAAVETAAPAEGVAKEEAPKEKEAVKETPAPKTSVKEEKTSPQK
jgi:large subunit ribosomal protein L25